MCRYLLVWSKPKVSSKMAGMKDFNLDVDEMKDIIDREWRCIIPGTGWLMVIHQFVVFNFPWLDMVHRPQTLFVTHKDEHGYVLLVEYMNAIIVVFLHCVHGWWMALYNEQVMSSDRRWKCRSAMQHDLWTDFFKALSYAEYNTSPFLGCCNSFSFSLSPDSFQAQFAGMFPSGYFYIISRKHGYALDVFNGETKVKKHGVCEISHSYVLTRPLFMFHILHISRLTSTLSFGHKSFKILIISKYYDMMGMKRRIFGDIVGMESMIQWPSVEMNWYMTTDSIVS